MKPLITKFFQFISTNEAPIRLALTVLILGFIADALCVMGIAWGM